MISRRDFLGRSTIAGTVALLGQRSARAGAELPPETRTLRVAATTQLCLAPLYVADEMLAAEGFTDLRRVPLSERTADALASGAVDIGIDFIGPLAIRLDAKAPLLVLAGAHVGCHEVFAGPRVRSLTDLRGKKVAVPALGSGQHIFVAAMLAYVGVDPGRDVTWLSRPKSEAMRLLAEGAIDAVPAGPPESYDFRAQKLGRVVVNTSTDLPWSRHFCCVIAANRDFVRRQPAATKRALRAILKGADMCALEPERVAHALVDRGYAARRESALRVLKDNPYGKWREYGLEDTVRFNALYLQQAGLIRSSPETIIAQGTDTRFLTELKKELKG